MSKYLFIESRDPYESNEVPAQSTANENVPSPPTADFVMVSPPVWRVLVNEAFLVAASTVTATAAPVDHPATGLSVTVHEVPKGMSDGVDAAPPVPPTCSVRG